MNYPRLLVLSNNSFSKSNSNGRTLGSLLQGWPKDRIAQFCISSDGADFEVCENYYCVTDADVLHSTIKLKSAKSRRLEPTKFIDSNNTADGKVKHRKTSLNMLARNFAWMLGIWRGKDFYNWIDRFKPDIILLQSGESFFMHDLALVLQKRTNSKLAIFNTEGFYFFKKDYFKGDGRICKPFFKLYAKIYKRYFSKFMHNCEKQIYGNVKLKEDYIKEFSGNAIVTYTSSNISFAPKPLATLPKFSYLGNLGFDRPLALIEFAETINKINPLFKLDVYGYAKNEAMKELLESCSSIRFHGVVPYSTVKDIIAQSDFLVHAESQGEEWAESLKYGFSTKIADSISSGKVFILYSSDDIACAEYIRSTGAGVFAASKEQLKLKIEELLTDSRRFKEIIDKSQRIALENHNPKRNTELVKNYLSN